MNINISELNEIAQVLSSGFKHYRLETMFWHPANAVAFANYNRFEVKPYRDVKKPFGVQLVLESIARSLGYHTYKGLLESGREEFQLTPAALNDLNPNPLNGFYTDCWESLTAAFLEKVLSGNGYSSKVVRNFKHSELEKYGAFSNRKTMSILHFVKDIHTNLESVHIDEKAQELLPVYAIADSIYFQAIEKGVEMLGYKAWFEADELDMCVANSKNGLELMNEHEIKMRFEDFLVKKEWEDTNYAKFIQSISYAMRYIYGMRIKFEGEGRSPLDKTVTLYVNAFEIKELMTAKCAYINFKNYQEACRQLMAKYADDKTLYSCDYPIRTIEQKYCAVSLIDGDMQPFYKGEFDIDNAGVKNYWINMSAWAVLLGKEKESVVSVEDMVKKIERIVGNYLRPIKIKTVAAKIKSDQYKYQYKYNISIEDAELLGVPKWNGLPRTRDWNSVPKVVTLLSDYPLKHYLGEMYIQTELCKILGYSMDDRFVGQPDTLRTHVDKLKITPTKTPLPSDQVWVFDPLRVVQGVSLFMNYFIPAKDRVSYYSQKHKAFEGVETENEITFSVGLRLVDMPHKYQDSELYEEGYTCLYMKVTVDKRTQKFTAAHFDVMRTKADEQGNFKYRFEECPYTKDVLEYLMGFKEYRDLIYKYFMEFYQGSKRELYEQNHEEGYSEYKLNFAPLYDRCYNIDKAVKTEVEIY